MHYSKDFTIHSFDNCLSSFTQRSRNISPWGWERKRERFWKLKGRRSLHWDRRKLGWNLTLQSVHSWLGYVEEEVN